MQWHLQISMQIKTNAEVSAHKTSQTIAFCTWGLKRKSQVLKQVALSMPVPKQTRPNKALKHGTSCRASTNRHLHEVLLSR